MIDYSRLREVANKAQEMKDSSESKTDEIVEITEYGNRDTFDEDNFELATAVEYEQNNAEDAYDEFEDEGNEILARNGIMPSSEIAKQHSEFRGAHKSYGEALKDTYFSYEVRQIAVQSLVPYHSHSFKTNDSQVSELAKSIDRVGILEPLLICRSQINPEKYEIVSGHRRYEASLILKMVRVPCRVASDTTPQEVLDEIMVIANLDRRNEFTVSELAKSVAILYNARKKQGYRNTSSSSDDEGGVERVRKIMASELGMTEKEIVNYLRFAQLISEFCEMLDSKKISKQQAYNIAFLSEMEQSIVARWLAENDKKIETEQSIMLKEQKVKDKSLDRRTIEGILSKEIVKKKASRASITISSTITQKYHLAEMSQDEVDKVIDDALSMYFDERENTNEIED